MSEPDSLLNLANARIAVQCRPKLEKLTTRLGWATASTCFETSLALAEHDRTYEDLAIKFLETLYHIAINALHSTEAEVIVGVLSLVDIVLTGSLLVIVIFSGYENFVSKIDHSNHEDWPAWMGSIDFTALKLKLLSSIVAISAIQLLKEFMAIKTVSDRELIWFVAIHLVFVVSSVLLALSDRIAGDGHGPAHATVDHEPQPAPTPSAPSHGESTARPNAPQSAPAKRK